MAIPMKEQMEALVGLQEIDLKIISLQREQQALPLILKESEAKLATLVGMVATKEEELKEFDKIKRQTTTALELNEERQKRAAEKMDLVKSGNEYTAANKELVQLKSQREELDKQAVQHDLEIEACMKEAEAFKAEANQLKADFEAKSAEVNGAGGKLSEQESSLDAERAPFLAKVEKSTLNRYNRVRKARAGIGLAIATKGQCRACNMMLPPQLFNMALRAEELHNCPACSRILFAKTESAQDG